MKLYLETWMKKNDDQNKKDIIIIRTKYIFKILIIIHFCHHLHMIYIYEMTVQICLAFILGVFTRFDDLLYIYGFVFMLICVSLGSWQSRLHRWIYLNWSLSNKYCADKSNEITLVDRLSFTYSLKFKLKTSICNVDGVLLVVNIY